MKLLFKFFITICIFLAAGNSRLHSGMRQDQGNFSSVKKIVAAHQHESLQANQADVATAPLTIVQKDTIDDVRESENENDEPASVKKCLDLTKYYTSIFCVRTPAHLSGRNKRSLPSYNKHYAYLSSTSRYIIFRVIRL